jgi:CMP-N-acetylneuraminic acid synthetase
VSAARSTTASSAVAAADVAGTFAVAGDGAQHDTQHDIQSDKQVIGMEPVVLAVIPARGGSKGVPGKNLAEVGGVPLVTRAARVCRTAGAVTDVVVSTDADDIARAAETAGARVVRRPAAIAGDTASSEDAVRHALDAFETERGRLVDVVLLVQCTSPFLTSAEIDAVARAVLEGADSALTAVPFHGFVWRTGDGEANGVNHDKAVRPRRQDRPEELLETGAAYAMRVDGFRKSGHRFFGRTAVVRADPARVLEIDEPADLHRARALAPLLDT